MPDKQKIVENVFSFAGPFFRLCVYDVSTQMRNLAVLNLRDFNVFSFAGPFFPSLCV